jgi:L-alanine-DL-glutamate epimerase-like enolase superfamily enzyme
MKIKSIESIPVRIPLTTPVKMAGAVVRDADNVLVRITTDTGLIGWGEAASAPNMTGEMVEGIDAAVRFLAPSLAGMSIGTDVSEIAAIHREMSWRMYANGSAKAAIDIALFDIAGQAAGKPIWALLGGKRRDDAPLIWLLGAGDEAAVVAEAKAKVAAGFRAVKVKVGGGDAVADASRTRAVRLALPKEVLVCCDANQGFSRDDARAYCRALVETPIDFVEQPLPKEDIEGFAMLAREFPMLPLAIDEGLHGLEDLEKFHARGAAAGGSLKLIKLGGLMQALDAARLAKRLDMRINLACKMAESSIAATGMLHLAAVVPDCAWGVSVTSQYLATDVTAKPLTHAAGFMKVPTVPGLGVAVDEARVRDLRAK